MLGPIRLDDVPLHPVLPELGLDHPYASRCMAIALLPPPAGERRIVEIPELAKALEDPIDHRLRRPRAAQTSRGLPSGARAGPEVPHGDLHRRARVGRLGGCFPAT